jgi:acetyl esterase
MRLAASGVVVATVDFRLSDEAPYPASMADINYAVRWLKAHAGEFNASSVGVGGMGFSSGGHMIMLNAMRPRDPRYAAVTLTEAPDIDASVAYVVAGWPVMDPLSRFRYAATIDRQDLIEAGLKYFNDEDGMSEANPQHILDRGEPARLPPVLIVHGAEDAQVTPKTVEIFTESYAQAGGVIELAKYPGEPHGVARDDTENTRRAIDAIKSFIARQLVML